MKSSFRSFHYLLLFSLVCFAHIRAGEAVRLYDFGADEIAYLALPTVTPKGSILLIPDSLGLPEVVASRCDLLAKLGYITMTVDFYNGQTANSFDQSRLIQSRIPAESARKTIAAALKMLTTSPPYRTNRIIVAAWGANMDFLREVLAEPDPKKPKIPLIALSWFEPQAPLAPDVFLALPRPLHVVTTNGAALGDLDKALEQQTLKNMPFILHSYKAKNGFLLQERTDEINTQAWVSIIEFWKKVTQDNTPPTEPEASPLSDTPAKKGTKPSIMPRR